CFDYTLGFFNRGAHDVAVFGPASVVVFDIAQAEQVFKYKPSVARALNDSAIGNGVLLGIDSFLLAINPLQLIRGFKRAVGIHRCAPGNALGSRNVTTALSGFTHPGRSDDFTGKFVWAPHIDQVPALLQGI